MCALAPFPTSKWPLLNPIGHELNYIYEGNQSIDPFLQVAPLCPSFTQASFDPCTVKKLNHNASERDRRKKVNSLYSSLRSRLPVADQMKKLSFPATVSRALEYIPELQAQVERLVQKKEELLLKTSQQCGIKHSSSSDGDDQLRKSREGRCLSSSSVSINRLSSDRELAIQISMQKDQVHNTQLSEILHLLEQQGFLLLNATSFESFGGVIFYNIHLQVESEIPYQLTELDIEALREKLLQLFKHYKNKAATL